MDVSYYYQILEMGIRYEKGRKIGKAWKIGEKKRLDEEVMFWQRILQFIENEERGIECSHKLFEELEILCKRYKLPNYERVLTQKDELLNSHCTFQRKKEEEFNIRNLINALLVDAKRNITIYKDKDKVYKIFTILHNLPKAMHGNTVLNNSNLVSYYDALSYTKAYMDDKMQKEYEKYFI